MSYKITSLHVYPVKACGGIALSTASLSATGIAYDRYWMLVDAEGKAVTQRDFAQLALFQPTLTETALIIQYRNEQLVIPKINDLRRIREGVIWGTMVSAWEESPEVHQWFSDLLGQSLTLVRKAEEPVRTVKNHPEAVVNFPDACPYLIVGQSSLDHLNSQLLESIPMDRFRANIIFSGGHPHVEDEWHSIHIRQQNFENVKLCARCNVITINQQTAIVNSEPLRTLTTYRRQGNKVLFGNYFKPVGPSSEIIKVGDFIEVN